MISSAMPLLKAPCHVPPRPFMLQGCCSRGACRTGPLGAVTVMKVVNGNEGLPTLFTSASQPEHAFCPYLPAVPYPRREPGYYFYSRCPREHLKNRVEESRLGRGQSGLSFFSTNGPPNKARQG